MLTSEGLWELCTVYPRTGINANGQPISGTPYTAVCNVTRKTKTLKTDNGTDIQSTAQVTLPAEFSIQAQDKIILPEGTALKVQDVVAVYGAYGIKSHTVAYL